MTERNKTRRQTGPGEREDGGQNKMITSAVPRQRMDAAPARRKGLREGPVPA